MTDSHVRTPKRAGKLSDGQLAALAASLREAKTAEKIAKAEAGEITAEIVAELKLRGVESTEAGGLKISRRARAVRKVNLTKLKDVVGMSLFRRLTTLALDTDRWNNAINTGVVTEAQVAAVEDENESAAWIEVKDVA